MSDYIIPQLRLFNNCLLPAWSIPNPQPHPRNTSHLIPPAPPAFFPIIMAAHNVTGMHIFHHHVSACAVHSAWKPLPVLSIYMMLPICPSRVNASQLSSPFPDKLITPSLWFLFITNVHMSVFLQDSSSWGQRSCFRILHLISLFNTELVPHPSFPWHLLAPCMVLLCLMFGVYCLSSSQAQGSLFISFADISQVARTVPGIV